MLVYTIATNTNMFYIWFTYLKKYGGLGEDDVVGIITDSRIFHSINNEEFANISSGCKFRIEFSTYKLTARIEAASQKYKNPFPLHKLNVYLDLNCLIINTFSINECDDTLFIKAEGSMTDNKYGGFFLEGQTVPLPGFSSTWFAFTQGEKVAKFFENVSKRISENIDSPLSTLDQPFYNYELFLKLSGYDGPQLCIMDPVFLNCRDLNKMISFICVDFLG